MVSGARAAGFALAGCAVVTVAAAQERGANPGVLDYAAGLQTEYHTNLGQLPDGDEQSTLRYGPFLRLSLDRVGRLVEARLSGDLNYDFYSDDLFENEFRGGLSADVLFKLLPERLSWRVENDLLVAPVNVLDRFSPLNLQQTNQLSTGPELVLARSAADELLLSARYSKFDAEESALDDERTRLGLNWNRSLAPSQSIGIGIAWLDVSVGESENSQDFEQTEASGQYEFTRTVADTLDTLAVDLGFAKIRFDDPGSEDFETWVGRLNWDREAPGGLGYSIELERELGTFAGDLGRADPGGDQGIFVNGIVIGAPFERRRAAGSLSVRREQIDLTAALFYDSQRYVDLADLDQDFYGGSLGVGYLFSPLLSLTSRVDLRKRELDARELTDEFLTFEAELDYRFTRHWSGQLALGVVDRSSNQEALSATDEYIRLSLTFTR